MQRWILAGGVIAALASAEPAEAQGPGLLMGLAMGPSLTEFLAANPVGVGAVIKPEWRFSNGTGIGIGLRFLVYRGVPNHGLLFVELGRMATSGTVRPVFAIRAGLFSGGDRGADDSYLGGQAGPLLGFEHPLSPDASLHVAGTLLATQALHRDFRWVGGLEAGIRFHH
ncbi:MAG: hypothetical protein AB7L66_02165 [Gemmatimonadales bacterium]